MSNSVEFQQVIKSLINEDQNGGDGGDSDVEGDECEIHQQGVLSHGDTQSDSVMPSDTQLCGSEIGMAKLTATGGTSVIGEILIDGGSTFQDGSQGYNVKIPSTPSDWRAPTVQHSKGEPLFSDVDNPGNWSPYYFRPVFCGKSGKSSRGKYSHHQLPTGARPVPCNENGKRMVNGWEFHYQG